ncbi:MAG: type II toxin-antitoxin system VapC family toxin [Pirellulales bacterium]|nr:type II toxin-antitoxin system VapC family toxin [Pirellulales bacterium]
MPQRLVFLDTSFVLAMENIDDPLHGSALNWERRLAETNTAFISHWGIILEIGDGYSKIGRRMKGQKILDRLLKEEGFYIFPLTDSLIHEGLSIYQTRLDKEWGLTDCISFALMRQEGIEDALTSDVHFRQAGFQTLLLNV